MNNALLNNIATEIVANKVMEDKLKEYEEKQEKEEQAKQNEKKLENDEDDIFKIDEEEERIASQMKERRFLEQGYKKKNQDSSQSRYGDYREIEEGEFLDVLLKNKKVVCHFYHQEFEKCKVMDKHLKVIAYDHPETLFVKINAENSPFFSVKLNIKVLPTVLFSNDGKVFERIVGFEGLEGVEDFKTMTLIRKLVLNKMIKPKNSNESGKMKISKKTKLNSYDDSDDDDY